MTAESEDISFDGVISEAAAMEAKAEKETARGPAAVEAKMARQAAWQRKLERLGRIPLRKAGLSRSDTFPASEIWKESGAVVLITDSVE